MSQNGRVINIPVQFKEAGNTMAQIMQTLQKAVREVDLESSLGKKLTSMMHSLQNQLDDYTQLTIEPTIDQTGLRKAERLMQTFAQRAGKIDTAIQQGNVFDFNLSSAEIDEISDLTAKVRELNAELAKLKKNGSSRATDSYLQEIGEDKLLDRARKASKTFKSDASLSKNQTALEAETKQARDNIARLQAEQTTLQEQINAYKAQLRQQQAALRSAQQASNKSKAIVDTGDFLTQFETFDYKRLHTKSGQLRGQTAVLGEFMDALMKDSEGGRIAEQNRHGAEMLLKRLGFDAATITTVLTQQEPQIRAAIAQALDIVEGSTDPISTQAYDRLTRAQSFANSYMRNYATETRYAQYAQEQQAVRDAQEAVDRTNIDLTKVNKAATANAEEIKNLQAMAAELESVTQALANFATALNQLETRTLQGKIDSAEQALNQKKADIKNAHIGNTTDLPNQRGHLTDLRRAGMDTAKSDVSIQDESEQFTNNLKQSIKHWMSAQQVINMVKDGIRQAYQDIQGLDKAMTNIAVVTDMSIGDLWDKINEYMSIAQQYGVTTQGVYEVSQLYYQQGLSTAEVMAATTETLKMARIAGMGYAEAADAMTVAIRAFKMEMSDAQHITDVYSKVAAVTASDTEELAIAMSKTASSAESVGSSFENTTAMLAVMIETTRESAQNLGSALKSIISRYGEMKVGLTVDSEGEEIDYNKVDTALKSVGISIKDAQGQFRDFDEVIFELSEKWDSLDKNTQRYIATIMAGNRQQSRFIALVDNWERLDEVAGAAQDSEDAGLLQYAKTLDSVETKLNNIKTSFQQFYMSVFNGEFVGGILDFVNGIIKALNKLGTLGSIFNITTIISGLKTGLRLIVNLVGTKFTEIYKQYQLIQQQMTQTADQESRKRANIQTQNEIAGQQQIPQGYVRQRRVDRAKQQKLSASSAKIGKASNALSLLGLGVNILGTASIANNWFGDKSKAVGTGINTAGNTLSGVGTGMAIGAAIGTVVPVIGNVAGAAIGGVIGGLIPLISGTQATIEAVKAIEEERYARLSEELEQKKIESAQASERYKSLNSYIDKLKELESTRFDSDENMKEWVDLNAQVLESYPELFSTFDEHNNVIVDLTSAETTLTQARLEAAAAAKEMADKQVEAALSGETVSKATETVQYGSLSQSGKLYLSGGSGGPGYAENPTIFIGDTVYDDLIAQGYTTGTRDQGALNRGGLLQVNRIENKNDIGAYNISKLMDLETNTEGVGWLIRYMGLDDEGRFAELRRLAENPDEMARYFDEGTTIDQVVYAATNKTFETYNEMAATLNTATREVDQSSQALNAAVLSGVRTYINASTLHLDKNSSYLALGNSNAAMQSYLYEAFMASGMDWKTWTTDYSGYATAFETIDAWFTEFYDQLELLGQVDEYNTFVKNSNLYTPEEYQAMLETFPMGDELQALLMEQFYEGLTKTRTNFAKALDRFNFGVFEGKDAAYIEGYLSEVLNDSIPKNYTDEVIAYADHLQNLVDTGKLTNSAAGELFNTYLDLWEFIDTNIAGQEDKLLARKLLAEADLTSAEGVAKFIDSLEDAGIDIDEATIKSLLPAALMNLNTAYSSLQNKIASNIDKTATAISNLEKGLDSYSEVVEMAEKYGLSIADDFEFQDGKWYLANNAESIDKVTKGVQTDIATEKQLVKEKTDEQIRIVQTNTPTDWGTLTYKEGWDDVQVPLNGLKNTDGEYIYPELAAIIESNWDAYIAWYNEQDETASRTFVDYLQARQTEILTDLEVQGKKLTEWQLAALERASTIRARTNELSNHYDKDTVAGYSSLSSKLTGYTPEEIATLEQQLGFKLTDYITQDADSGLYSIDKSIANLSSIPLEYRNQIISLVESEEKAALDAIKTLGASAAKGDKGVYGEAFSNSMRYQAAEVLIPQWLKAASENRTIGDGLDPNALLRENIAKELSARTGQTYTATSPEVIKAANEMVAGYNDGMDENILRYIELKKKELFGTITEAEKLELDSIVDADGLSAELTDAFANAGSKTIEKYIAVMKAAIASGADFEEVEQYIKDGYSAQLQQLATGVEDIPTLDAFDIMKNISEAEGQYTNDMLASMFSQVYAETGNEVDMSDFSEYFEIDPETKNWVLKAGKSVNDFLAEEYGGNVPEWITSAFSTSEAQKTVNDAVELDDLGTNVTNTVGTMMSDLANTSLSDLVLLYENIHGEGSFADSGLLESYQAALEAAKRGETSALIAILQTLTQAAINAGADVDTAQIQATVKDAHNTLVSGLVTSINNGLSGTLSNIDFNNLVEQIGGVPEDYRRYVTETYDGLKLSAEGALVIASELIDKFGNTSLVVESLVAQLGGSGALGSYKDIEEYIEKVENGTIDWGEETSNVLNILYKMKNEYSQLAEDARFDFMNQDHFDGAADNWYTFTDNMSTAIDTLKSAFEKGGKIDYKSFDNIITWISDLSVAGLDTQLGNTGKTLREFTDEVLATVDATGNLDLSAAAANLGISMDDMAGALEGGLQEVAKQQVAYWKKYLDFLKGLKKLQEAQDEVSLHIPIQNEVDGTWTYEGNTYDSWEALMAAYGGNLGMDLTAAQQFFDNFTYTGENGTTITLSGKNNPLNFILGELDAFEPDGTLKAGMEQKIGQYIGQVFAWINTISEQDIDQYINEDTGEITIPWSEILQIELDTSTTPEVNTTNAGEAGEQTQDAAEGAAESALTASGATPNGDGSYTYTLDDMTLKIQMGANGSVEIDLTNATGTLPSAAELRKVFEGQEGFTATDDNNWVFTDPNLGFSVKCSNGTLSFDTSSMTAPAAPTAAELSAILGTTWTTTDGGKTYTTNLNGVSFVYNSATGKININASSFQLTGGLDATSLATILGGTWTTEDNGATYTATIAGTSFVYESSSGLVKIDGSKFTLSGGLSATELATILGGSWSSPDGGITYESTINGVTFTYKSASGTVEIDSSKFTLSAGLSAEQLTALLGSTWSTEDGITYKSVISGVTFTYESTTGTINIDPSGFTVSANLTADQLKTLLGGTWTSEDGITYKSTINGVTFTYESTTGKLIVTPPTTATEPTNTDFITLMQAQGWTHENGVYTKDFGGGTLTYNATAGALTITPSATMTAANPDMATLLDSAFGVGGWQLNENGGYDILNTTTGEVLYTLPAKITVTPTAGSNVTSGDNGLTADVDVTLTPNTSAIDTALAAYNNQPIKISLELTNSKNSLLNSPAYNDIIAKTRAYLDKNLSYDDMQTAYYQAYSAFSPYIPSMSREDLLALQELQSSIDFGLFINEGVEDPWWTALGEEVSAALEALPEEGELTGITALFNSLSGENLAANLLGITSLFSTLVTPELATLDLTGFITQLQSMGELELDDEEINAFVTAITALTTAITALPTEVNVTVNVSSGNTYNVVSAIKRALDSIKNKTVTVTTKHVNSGGDGGDDGDENPGTPTDADYAGNVSGLALAKGNATDKLLAGAHLAGKTLVGELGPELAVYDNQYHLLGRNGAEFVDLPNDAIVFNHRQTAGIIKGQAGYRGQALANGNVTGPAAAGGIDAAISAVEKIIKLWSNIADSSLSDLLSGGSGGGGGSGNTIKAVTEELQEWYNLSRQIEHIEQEINNLIAERSNLLESDGAAYLRSLREEQALLREQVATQQTLLDYQKLQLQRQADHITDPNSIWSKFLKIDENGLLQYKNGNEMGGGKGALEVLQQLNEMSGEDQVDYITNTLGYSYTNADGEKLEGEDLVKQFFQEFQDQIDSYDSLYDTVHQTEEKLQQLSTSIEEINSEIKENQMELEQEIFDILVEAWEAEIEALEEQKELIEEANEAYIDGLNEALQTERDMYTEQETTADREQLQRQLSLLRRSGGSASEIASLEEQLDSMLKEEYFSKQEDMIQNISDANDEQIRKLEEQIRLEEEALEYQKENGVLWSKVYEVMAGSSEQILAFMQGTDPKFWEQSALQQGDTLDQWARRVGIFTEDRTFNEYADNAKGVWDSGAIWQQEGMSGLKSTYDSLSESGKATLREQFAGAYANARLAGDDHETAMKKASESVTSYLQGQADANEAEGHDPAKNTPNANGAETWYVQGPGNLNFRETPSKNGKRISQLSPGTAVQVLSKEGDWFKVKVGSDTGYVMSQYLTKTKPGTDDDKEESTTKYRRKATVTYVNADGTTGTVTGKGVDDSKWTAEQIALRYAKSKIPAGGTYQSVKYSSYSKGGLVDYTGLALVHGKPGKPEAFLNAKQTAMITEAVKSIGDGGALDGIKATLAALNSTIRSIVNNNTTQTSSFTVAPGAVTIQVAQLNDSYDVEELSKDVMNRMVAIASKSTNRGVNRR